MIIENNKKQRNQKTIIFVSYFLFFLILTGSARAEEGWSIQLNNKASVRNNQVCFNQIGVIVGEIPDEDDKQKWQSKCFQSSKKNKLTKDEIEIELIRNNLFPKKILGKEISLEQTASRKYPDNHINREENDIIVFTGSNITVFYQKGAIAIELNAKALNNGRIGDLIEVKPENAVNNISVRITDIGKAVFQ
ncbi:MAG: flagella basal body P-ring formation protein FlgA [Spirochaetia bacterium]|nr:flagella basal body P-ring formation protein FlgA [Spirochaetia bacterium]